MTKAVTTNSTPAKDIAETWDVATQVMWDGETLAEGLIETLDLRRPVLRILDASCGNGMPGVFLNKTGVTCAMSDGSAAMVQDARKRCESILGQDHGVDLRVAHWNELPEVWGEQSFDVIMIRGNSLPHILNWDSGCGNEKPSETALRDGYSALVASMRAVRRTLRPGGLFYVDCSQNCVSSKHPYIADKEMALSDGRNVHLHWNMASYPEQSIRRWENTMKFSRADGSLERLFQTTIMGLLCGPDHLRSILDYAGFSGFKLLHPRGENVNVPFLCYVEPDAVVRDRRDAAVRAVWNDNAVTSYGLFDATPPFAPHITAAVAAESNVEKVDEVGVMAVSNRALHTWQEDLARAVLHDSGNKPVTSVLEFGCGAGRSTLELVARYHDTVGYVLGVDSDCDNVTAARYAAAIDVNHSGIAVEFSEFPEGATSLPDSRTFSLAVARCAFSQKSEKARRAALRAAHAALEDGGVLLLDDRVSGVEPVSARMYLHYCERLGVREAWSAAQFAEELVVAGFDVVEQFDLSGQQAASYKAVSKRAAAVATQTTKRSPQYAALRAQEYDYSVSATGAANGECGWVQFVCRK